MSQPADAEQGLADTGEDIPSPPARAPGRDGEEIGAQGIGKLGWDATKKWPGETEREWGRRIAMDDAIGRAVDEK